jgi:hypothetical protein
MKKKLLNERDHMQVLITELLCTQMKADIDKLYAPYLGKRSNQMIIIPKYKKSSDLNKNSDKSKSVFKKENLQIVKHYFTNAQILRSFYKIINVFI